MSSVTPIELRAIESVLGMRGGYVLDFTNASFERFFRSEGVEIYDTRFEAYGTSKANRLRSFLEIANDRAAGKILELLGAYGAEAGSLNQVPEADLARYRGVVARLLGRPAAAKNVDKVAPPSESQLLSLVFRPEAFRSLLIDSSVTAMLIDRMDEARRCIDAKAYLASVILCGSVLEGMCLGYGSQHPELVNRAYAARYGKDAKRFHEWRLAEWIEVLADVGVLSQNVVKFGTALRDFRNYVHPFEQLATGFRPDTHTARIAFQVVIAASDDVARAQGPK